MNKNKEILIEATLHAMYARHTVELMYLYKECNINISQYADLILKERLKIAKEILD